MTLVGMYADTSPACVSITGNAVREPPPFWSLSFAARWAAKQQRNLSISRRVLGEIVVDAKRVLFIVAEVFTDRAPGVWRQILHGRRITRRSGHNNGVIHRAVF